MTVTKNYQTDASTYISESGNKDVERKLDLALHRIDALTKAVERVESKLDILTGKQ